MTNALEISQLKKTYSNGIVGLSGIDLTVEKGAFFGLLGPNGAGKSTTIGILCSLVRKTEGVVKVFGMDIDTNFPTVRSMIGLVPQEYNFNIFESPLFMLIKQAGYYGVPPKIAYPRAKDYLIKMGLWEQARRPTQTLSGGMKRRLMIARSLMSDPKLLILDEPTAGVDISLRRFIWTFLKDINKQGVTIILTTHYLEEAEHLCREIAIIDKGKIVEHGQTKHLLSKLNIETFVLDLQQPLFELPNLGDFSVRLIDSLTIEVDISKEKDLNQFFSLLTQCKITIVSMRNKINRLEELFLNLVEK